MTSGALSLRNTAAGYLKSSLSSRPPGRDDFTKGSRGTLGRLGGVSSGNTSPGEWRGFLCAETTLLPQGAGLFAESYLCITLSHKMFPWDDGEMADV